MKATNILLCLNNKIKIVISKNKIKEERKPITVLLRVLYNDDNWKKFYIEEHSYSLQ